MLAGIQDPVDAKARGIADGDVGHPVAGIQDEERLNVARNCTTQTCTAFYDVLVEKRRRR